MRFWIARNFLRVTNVMFTVYFMWEIVVKYDSVFLASLVPAFSLLGYVVIAVPFGYYLDRLNRSKLIFLTSILSFFVYSILMMSDALYVVYGVALISFMLFMTMGDAFYASIKELVVSEDLSKAMSMGSIGRAISDLVGILAGGVTAYISPASFPPLVLLLSVIPVVFSFPSKMEENSGSGYSYTHALKVIKLLIPLLILAMTINGTFVVLDVYASGLFHLILKASALYYTLFLLSFSLGAIVGGVVGGLVAKKIARPLFLSLISLGFGLSFVAIALDRSPSLESIISFLLGISVSLINIPLDTLLTRIVPNQVMGRVNSIMQLFFTGSSPVMAFVYGYLTNFFSLVDVIMGVGIFGIMMSLPSYFVIKNFMKIKDEDVKRIMEK